jgi:peptidoglycan/xylan/chitin deacetylase (PgdA/CDA1 family)
LRFLRRHFNILPLRELVSHLRSGSTLDPRTVVLTVDDAYADFGEHAYPVFREHGIPVTIYVVSEFAGGSSVLQRAAFMHFPIALCSASAAPALGSAFNSASKKSISSARASESTLKSDASVDFAPARADTPSPCGCRD